jgi:hypothetical protein
MMRLWERSHAKTPAITSSAGLSLAAHAVLITGAIAATAHPTVLAKDLPEPRAVFLNPTDRFAGRQGQAERLRFVDLTATGPMASRPGTDIPEPRKVLVAGPPVPRGEDSVTAPEVKPLAGPDSVLSVLEVDVAVTRYINSAAPAYPPDLLQQNVEGAVSARYVVDTTGYAIPASLTIISATRPQFALAVREALPFMRFHPAMVGERKVRQQVEQDFTFRIEKTKADSARGGRGSG